MTEDQIDDLKREHNRLLEEGTALYERLTAIYNRIEDIRKTMFHEDPDACIEAIFAGTMSVDGAAK